MSHRTLNTLTKAVILTAGLLAALLFAPLSRAAAVDVGALGKGLGGEVFGRLESLGGEQKAIQNLYRLAVDFDTRLRETLGNYPLEISDTNSRQITDVLNHLEGLSTVLLRGVEAYRAHVLGLPIGDPTFTDISLPRGLFKPNRPVATVSLPPASLLFGTAL
ncbi:MAG TPA: hypothetical protein EYH03_06945, partial [Chromatiales bacterium]|nr:hypothetical protein [Chromatiales bacterium]